MNQDDEDMALPRLIAQFPGVDIGVLSTALERSQGNFETATNIVKEMIGETAPNVRKPRPSGSARRREQKISNDGENTRNAMSEEDEALARVLAYEEDELFANNLQEKYDNGIDTRPGTAHRSGNNLHKSETSLYTESRNNSNQKLAQRKDDPMKSLDGRATSHGDIAGLVDPKELPRAEKIESLTKDNSFNDPSRIVDVMTKSAIAQAAATSKLSQEEMVKNATLLTTNVKPMTNMNRTPSPFENSQISYSDDDDDDDNYESDENGDTSEQQNIAANPKAPKNNGGAGQFGQNMSLQEQMQEIFSYTSAYNPETVELFPQFKCFIPDYIPAVGDIDPMIKIPQPTPKVKGQQKSNQPETNIAGPQALGLRVLDEPSTKQSDPAVLDLQLRAASKGNSFGGTTQHVRSIQLNFSHAPASKQGQKALAQWVQNVSDLHTHKPPDRVEYSKRMPDIETLMKEWPPSIDMALTTGQIKLPTAEIDLKLNEYSKVICNILDIPVNTDRQKLQKSSDVKAHSHIESLHVLFTLYSEFKNSQHFNR